MRRSLLAALLIASAFAVAPASAQDDAAMDHGSMHGETNPFAAVNAEMHEAMDVALTGDVDKDFVLSMIPHHEGAVAMARIVIEKGKDPEIRALAEAVVKAQETEIAQMKAWLAKHPD
ncbi:MAG: DUF305 domain-containing protein [Rhizobiales bacterium]|nr:DUF305 domain-containing protein [Hyphomicrobiales bacterium]